MNTLTESLPYYAAYRCRHPFITGHVDTPRTRFIFYSTGLAYRPERGADSRERPDPANPAEVLLRLLTELLVLLGLERTTTALVDQTDLALPLSPREPHSFAVPMLVGLPEVSLGAVVLQFGSRQTRVEGSFLPEDLSERWVLRPLRHG